VLRAFDDAYYPNIIMRPAEMRAISELPEVEKDSLFPIIRMCPWVGSRSFDNAINKIIEVYGERPFICDLNRSYSSNSDRDAVVFFESMKTGADSTTNWINFISANSSFIPTVQHSGYSLEEIFNQVDAFVDLERGCAFRITPAHMTQLNDCMLGIARFIERSSSELLCVIIDLGMIANQEISILQAQTIIEELRVFENIRIIISSASFPNNFTQYSGTSLIDIKSRQLFLEIRRRYNNLNLSYSDWASTKPRTSGGGGAPIPKRIDMPRNSSWVIARNQEENWSYPTAANQLIQSEYWENLPNVWGIHMIEQTAQETGYYIDSPQKSAAVRINIHLFIQNHFGSDAGSISTEEPWVDI